MKDDAVDRHASSRTPFFCCYCCEEKGVPYNAFNGTSGYLATDRLLSSEIHQNKVQDTHIVVKNAKNSPLTVQIPSECTLSQLEERLSLLERDVPVKIKEAKALKIVVAACKRWFEEVNHFGSRESCDAYCSFLHSRAKDLWLLLFAGVSLPIAMPSQLLVRMEHELWIRFLLHASSGKKGIEYYDVNQGNDDSIEQTWKDDWRCSKQALSKLRGELFLDYARNNTERTTQEALTLAKQRRKKVAFHMISLFFEQQKRT
jgi:hypothetical protein